jgi:hypothetical protein
MSTNTDNDIQLSGSGNCKFHVKPCKLMCTTMLMSMLSKIIQSVCPSWFVACKCQQLCIALMAVNIISALEFVLPV